MASHTIKVWPKMVKGQNTPQDSSTAGYLLAGYCDSFSRNVASEKVITSDKLFDMAFNYSPSWVNGLTKLRNAIAKPLDLEVGICFADTTCEQNAQEVVFGMLDKHLTFHVSLQCGEKEPGGQTLTITTAVKFNDRLGRLYLSFIRSFHKVITRSMLKRVVKRLK